jgi:hypothetical protein
VSCGVMLESSKLREHLELIDIVTPTVLEGIEPVLEKIYVEW